MNILQDTPTQSSASIAISLVATLSEIYTKNVHRGITATLNHSREVMLMDPMHERRLLNNLQEIYTAMTTHFCSTSGTPRCNAVVGTPSVVTALDKIYNEMHAIFIEHYKLMYATSVMTTHIGLYSHTSLYMLSLAAVDTVRTLVATRQRTIALNSYTASHFAGVRRLALAVLPDTPIASYSMHDLMHALFALYQATTTMEYSADVERYFNMLLWRGRQMLMRPGTADVHNVMALRQRVTSTAGDEQFRYSPMYLRDITILHYALTDWFDRGTLIPCMDVMIAENTSEEHLRCTVHWLRVSASRYVDRLMQDSFIRANMYAGEKEFFLADTPEQETTDHEIIRRHRTSEFLIMMVNGLLSPHDVIQRDLKNDVNARQGLQLTLAIASTLVAQITAANPSVQASNYVIMGSEWTVETAASLRRVPRIREPVLVMCCNRLQLCYKGYMHRYNNAVVAVLNWMLIVHKELNDRLAMLPIDALIDRCLYVFESGADRAKRKTGRVAAADTSDFFAVF